MIGLTYTPARSLIQCCVHRKANYISNNLFQELTGRPNGISNVYLLYVFLSQFHHPRHAE